MSGSPLGGGEGMGEAREAFQSVIDAETPSRSKRDTKREPDQSTMSLDELFPRREIDRSEEEGGADDEPDVVKKARAAAKGNKNFGEVEDEPRDPTEDEDDEGPDDDGEPQEQEQEEPEDDEDEEDEEQEAARGKLDLNQIVEVTVDGKPVEVSLNEALRGYIRQETFHQRMGDLAQGVQQLETRSQQMSAYQQQFVERAEMLEQYVAAFMPKEPNWDELYAADPANAARIERQWRSFNEQVGEIAAKRAQTQQELASSQAASLRSFAEANRAHLARLHPEWRKEKVWKRDQESMRRTARSHGYADGEIDQLYDARGVEILLKASKYDRMMATKPRPVKNGFGQPSRQNGATPRQRNASRSFERAEKRLSRTGSIKAAASVFERILNDEG